MWISITTTKKKALIAAQIELTILVSLDIYWSLQPILSLLSSIILIMEEIDAMVGTIQKNGANL